MEKIIELVSKLKNNPKIKYFRCLITDEELNTMLILKNNKIFLQFLFNNPNLNKIIDISQYTEEQLYNIFEEISDTIIANTRITKIKTKNLNGKIIRKLY